MDKVTREYGQGDIGRTGQVDRLTERDSKGWGGSRLSQ